MPTGHRGPAPSLVEGPAEIPSIAVRTALDVLRPVLEDAAIGKSGHDLKFDAIMLARHGVTLHGLDTDTMLTSYLIDATRAEHLLEDLALEHVSYKALKEEDVCGRGAKAISLADVPVEALAGLRGRTRRSRRPAGAGASATCWRNISSPTSTSSSSGR